MSAHPAVTQTWATLRIGGTELDTAEVTHLLGLSPTHSHSAGEHHGQNGRLVWKKGLWDLSSEGQLVSLDLEEHIIWILDLVEPVADRLTDLIQRPGVQADIFCFWEVEEVNTGLDLGPSVMARLGALGLSLGLDVYFAF